MQVSGRGQGTVCAIRFAALPVGRESSIYRSTAVHPYIIYIIYRYGNTPLAQVLAGPIQDVMLVLFPIEVTPMGALEDDADPNELRPVRKRKKG